MKKKALLIILTLLLTSGFAQVKKLQNNPSYDNKWLHLGFTLGLSTLNYDLEPSSDLILNDSVYSMEVDNFPGFHLGVITDIRLMEYLNLRCQPGMLFGERSITYKINSKGLHPIDDDFESELEEYTMNMPTIYLDLPVLLKFKGVRINNFRPYMIGGASIKYDLETVRVENENEGYTLNIEPFDYFCEFGVGIDFYLVYFKLSTELKYCQGLNNLIIQEDNQLSQTIDKLHSRAIMFSLHFE